MSFKMGNEGQEGQGTTTDKLETKVLIVVQDKPLSEKQQEREEQYFESNAIELTPNSIPRTASSCSYDRQSSITLIDKSSLSIKQRFSQFSNKFRRKSTHYDATETPPTTIIDESNSNVLIKKRFRSLQNLSKASRLNNKLLSKDWCCNLGGSKAAIKAIMDKNRPKAKPVETTTRGIKRSSLLSASDLGSKGNIVDRTGSVSSTSSVEYGNEAPDVPVRFVWDHGGESVHVCILDGEGSKVNVALDKNDKNSSTVQEGKSYAGVWETTINLKPGRCEFR